MILCCHSIWYDIAQSHMGDHLVCIKKGAQQGYFVRRSWMDMDDMSNFENLNGHLFTYGHNRKP